MNSPGMLLNKIIELEGISRNLEVRRENRHSILESSFRYVDTFIENLPAAKAYVRADCPELKKMKITDAGKPFEDLLQIIRSEVDHAGINAASGGHLGYIPGGGLWMSSIGDMMAAATNRYAGIIFSGTGAVLMENQLIRWLISLVGYPDSSHGNISSGGSIANLTAITTARDAFHITSTNVRTAVIYYTEQVHHCIHKALHITGLDEAIHRTVPMNEKFQMNAEVLASLIESDLASGLKPFLVIASAGTTNTGSVDPLDQIADICEQHNTWFHVDAAYGGFFMLVDEVLEKFKGIERSDSLVLDPHKGLFLPFGIGVVLVKDGQQLIHSHAYEASYLVDTMGFEETSPSDCGPELTKHFRGLRMWLPLHYHGLIPFKACLKEKLYLCRYFHEQISLAGFETWHYPELSVTMFRYPAVDKNEFNKKLIDLLHKDGRIFFSSTILNGEVWIRCAVLSFRTHLREIDLALGMINENLRKLMD